MNSDEQNNEEKYNKAKATSHVKKPCCFYSYYYDNNNNQFSTCCGDRIRRISLRLCAQSTVPVPPQLRRQTRHAFCLSCGINGERADHTFCGICSTKLLAPLLWE